MRHAAALFGLLILLAFASATQAALWWPDTDFDGYGDSSAPAVNSPSPPSGHVGNNLDCDDTMAMVSPDATEICDGIDNNCDGQTDEGVTATFYADTDGDGYGDASAPVQACAIGTGVTDNDLDCDDTNPNAHPEATEICDGVDNDCNGQIDDVCVPYGINSITDVENDQGRQVRVRWIRSSKDFLGSATPVLSYSLYRRVAQGLKSPPGNWDFVLNVPATGENTYSVVATTLCDSTATGTCWSYFYVRAHTAQPLQFEDSQIRRGYSIDNLAPGVPQGLTAQPGAGNTSLHWLESDDEDFQYYNVYRSANPGFVPGPATLVHSTASAGWVDASAPAGEGVYKVTALDFAGNESPAAAVETVTAIGDRPSQRGTALSAPYPNPFNPRTTFELRVGDVGGDVRVDVYDSAGRRVARLVDGPLAAGTHSLVFEAKDDAGGSLGSGVYYVRMIHAGEQSLQRAVLLK